MEENKLSRYNRYYDQAIKRRVRNELLRKQLDREIEEDRFAAAYWAGRIREVNQNDNVSHL